MRCKRCNVWMFLPDDKYCSYCGNKLIGVDIQFSPERIYRDSLRDFGEIELSIANVGRNPLQINDIHAEPNWVEVMDKPADKKLAPEERYRVRLLLHWQNLADEPVRCKVSVRTGVDEVSKGFEVLPKPDIEIKVPREVTMLVDEDDSNSPIESSVSIRKGKVVIGDIVLSGIPDASIQTEREFPIELDSTTDESTLPFSIAIDTQKLEADQQYSGTLSVVLGDKWGKAFEEFTLWAKSPSSPVEDNYKYYVAVDFGNTNSCCAVANSEASHQSELIPLVESSMNRVLPDTIIPSVIYYQNLSDGQYDYLVGQAAKDHTRHPTQSRSSVESVKRQLGREEPIKVYINGREEELSPEEVTGHIIKYILDKAERKVKRRITKCIATHPAGFSQKQIEALKSTFEKCGIDRQNLKLINESTAAAFDYIINRQEEPFEYTLLVYDSGGSTTDVTLLHVEDTPPPNIPRRITMEVLGVDGRNFGGDDVTNRLANFILEQCQKLYNSSKIPFEPADYKNNPELEEDAYINKTEIFHVAEQAKILLSSHETVTFGANPSGMTEQTGEKITLQLPLTVYNASNQTETITVSGLSITRKDSNSLIEKNVDTTIEMAEHIVQLAGIGMLDVVLPVGLSCNIPLVKRKLAEAFGEENLYWYKDPSRLKECVVRGAYFRYALEEELSPIKIITKMKPITRSRFGIKVFNRLGQPEFCEIIAKGMQLPVERSILAPVPSRTIRIEVCRNAGEEDSFLINGKRNKDIQVIGEYKLLIPPEIPEDELNNCKIKMKLGSGHNIQLAATFGNKGHVTEIECQPIIYKEKEYEQKKINGM